MKVLSIQTGHNATIALSNKGEIVGVLGQEKCDNIKKLFCFSNAGYRVTIKRNQLA